MMSFLITFKPAAENPVLGWPLEELQKLVVRYRAGEEVIQPWRFHNRKDVALGNRVFLLLQGKCGPAIIGYGEVAGQAEELSGKWYVPIRFESIVDPTVEVFANRDDLFAIKQGRPYWRIQSSGVQLPTSVADELEARVVGISPKATIGELSSKPKRPRDKLTEEIGANGMKIRQPRPSNKARLSLKSLEPTRSRENMKDEEISGQPHE